MPDTVERAGQGVDVWHAEAQTTRNDYLSNEGATLAEVIRGLNATVRLVETLHHEVKDFAIGQATLRLTISSIEEVMKELRKALTASEPASLPIRMVLLEREIEDYKRWKQEQEQEKTATRKEYEANSWQMRIAVICSVLSFAGSVVMAFGGWILKHN